MTALFTQTDLEDFLGVPVDADRAVLLADLASVAVLTVAGNPTVVPDRLKGIALGVAARAYVNPAGVQSEQIGQSATNYGTVSAGIYLTADERRVCLPNGGLVSVPLANANARQWVT
jgi:hypothetical protein